MHLDEMEDRIVELGLGFASYSVLTRATEWYLKISNPELFLICPL